MNGYQFMLIMSDLMLNIKLGMRLTNPQKGLSRLKSQYKQMLGLPRNTKNRDLFIALYENVLEINRDKFNEGFVLRCQDFYEDLFTAEFND